MARTKQSFVPDDPISASVDTEISALFIEDFTSRRTVPMDIEIDRIRPNPFQARQTFTGVEELAAAIRAQGFTSRLRVRRDPQQKGLFQLVYGERRLRAAQLAGLTTLPCDVAEHSDEELLEIGLAENIQRRDLDPLEEALTFSTVIQKRGYSIRRLAERLGKDKGYIENRLALLRVPDDVQALVSVRPDTIRVARILAQLSTPDLRRPLIEGVASGALSQQDVIVRVRALLDGTSSLPALAGAQDTVRDGPAEPQGQDGRAAVSQPSTAGARDTDPAPSATSPFFRAMERDKAHMLAILSRWRQRMPRSADDEQTSVLRFIQDELLPQLEAMMVELREARK